MNENVRFVFRQIYERFEDYKGDFPWWVVFLVVLCGCGYIWCVGERCAVEMCWCSSSVGWQGCWLAPRSNPINPLATPGLKSAAGGQKKYVDARKTKLSRLPLALPETASLSPTAAKSMKHHTASMIFTYSLGLQHGEPRNVRNRVGGEEEEDQKTHSRDGGEDPKLIC